MNHWNHLNTHLKLNKKTIKDPLFNIPSHAEGVANPKNVASPPINVTMGEMSFPFSSKSAVTDAEVNHMILKTMNEPERISASNAKVARKIKNHYQSQGSKKGKAYPPGLAKKSGGMPPGLYKKFLERKVDQVDMSQKGYSKYLDPEGLVEMDRYSQDMTSTQVSPKVSRKEYNRNKALTAKGYHPAKIPHPMLTHFM